MHACAYAYYLNTYAAPMFANNAFTYTDAYAYECVHK